MKRGDLCVQSVHVDFSVFDVASRKRSGSKGYRKRYRQLNVKFIKWNFFYNKSCQVMYVFCYSCEIAWNLTMWFSCTFYSELLLFVFKYRAEYKKQIFETFHTTSIIDILSEEIQFIFFFFLLICLISQASQTLSEKFKYI